jgi:hypothetical protein
LLDVISKSWEKQTYLVLFLRVVFLKNNRLQVRSKQNNLKFLRSRKLMNQKRISYPPSERDNLSSFSYPPSERDNLSSFSYPPSERDNLSSFSYPPSERDNLSSFSYEGG